MGEWRWEPYVRGDTALEFSFAYLCAGKDGRIFTEMLTAGLSPDKWNQVAWVMPAREIPRPPVARTGSENPHGN